MDAADLDRLVAAHSESRLRVFAVEIDGRRLYVKIGVKNFPNRTAERVSRLIDRLFPHRRVPWPEQEIKRISALAAQGFVVPEVVCRTDRYLALSDIGMNLEQAVMQAAPAAREELLRDAARMLRRLHDSGQWHGAARLKNLTLSPRGVGMIDLENRIDAFIPLFGRQYWDLWSLGHSAAFFDHTGALSAVVMRAYGRSLVRGLLWASAVLFVGSYVVLRPFQPLRRRELRQTIANMGGLFRLCRHE